MKAVFVFVLVGCTPALPPPNLDISQELSIRRFYWAGFVRSATC